jgi:3-oxoacyl-[acyl-carrier-protein] synthase II
VRRPRPRRRVAVTGLGLITPTGNDVSGSWDALLAGRSAVAPISHFDASGFITRIGAEVRDFEASDWIDDRKLLKMANRSHGFALAAAEQAFADAGIRPQNDTANRWACSVGTGMMGTSYEELEAVHRHSVRDGELDTTLLLNDPTARDPMAFCRSQSTAGMALLMRRFGIRGNGTSVHTACASGGQAVGTAMKLIRRGGADFALAGGFDSMLNPVGLAGFCLLSALSTDNDTPLRASRPFDLTRNGFVLGEGAGMLVLEEWEAARQRGARIYAELAGDGNSLSSYRITDSPPTGDGPIQAMRMALADAGASLDEVDYINAHGTSTPMNDRSEAAAIEGVFGERTGQIPVSSTKSSMGHLIAAAGAVEAVVCALAIHSSQLPMNANFKQTDPNCERLRLVLDQSHQGRVRIAMSNSLGFGGSNSSLVLRHPDDVDDAIKVSG